MSVGGGAPAITMGHERARILNLDPKVSAKIPQGQVFIVADLPSNVVRPDDELLPKMMQRIVLAAPVDVEARLVSIFYQMLRDHIQPSTLESLLQVEEACLWDQSLTEEGVVTDDKVIYSNPYLEEYAKDMVARIMGTGVSQIKYRKAD